MDQTSRATRPGKRPLVACFTKAYHGNDPGLAPAPAEGVVTARTRDVLRVPWNETMRSLR